jgi:hypothetical protein
MNCRRHSCYYSADEKFVLKIISTADKIITIRFILAQKKKHLCHYNYETINAKNTAKTQNVHIAVTAGSKQGMVRAPCPKRTKTASAFFAVFACWAAAQTRRTERFRSVLEAACRRLL